MSHFRQSSLHELVTLLWAPSVCLSSGDGQIRAQGLDGFYTNDYRVLSGLEVEVADAVVEPVGCRLQGPASAVFTSRVRLDGDEGADPSVVMHRYRSVGQDGLEERLELVNYGAAPVRATVRARARTDLAPVHVVRGGRQAPHVDPRPVAGGACWAGAVQEVLLTAEPVPARMTSEDADVVLSFTVDLAPEQPAGVTLRAIARNNDPETAQRTFLSVAPRNPPVLPHRTTGAEEPRDPQRRKLLQASVRDLQRMLLADPLEPADSFLAAGSPWYFTLFGRDALWSASLLLPGARRLALGTLRTLQRRQGERHDAVAEEEPGKILHEVRRETLRLNDMVIPPLYFGTIDATMLWVRLLHSTWQAGVDEAEIEALLPSLLAALEWITAHGDSDADGFIEYRSSTRGGLANQGWKDTPDAVRWADGRRVASPLALCEVQGYAYAAATQGATLLDAFGLPGADRWRDWAARLQQRFRATFWIDDATGVYPAIALDADKRPVDGAASNMAHLLGTGLLNSREADLVARRLSRPDLDCGYGLRTLSSTSRAFNPHSYHCGSVWPHDTAIAVLGLAAEGHHAVAHSLAEGVVTAAEEFAFRLPELYAGTSAHDGEPVLAYPNACRPQAWASAGAVAMIDYLESHDSTNAGIESGDRPGLLTAVPEPRHT
ncbi:glycogen debranching N-terminal domain-containing protein [Streptomyces malaysiensis subsp. malaysiensis]|uniref:glycogen debranching N-terminal domain-containing protein n=1 Tax=Streptomyces malaysiensis TaxID=92644 RepID=UPI0024BF8AEE|nr:glycogen debranching N-terminal domain-containing protein [Streptomyces sp. NA07423]WHX15895.1 glycogen debranching N-terminal domain-containing protein [Streptomyces sp. NA07423]